MRSIDLSAVTWRKSSHSNTDGGQCLEVADNLFLVPVRDSKTPDAPALVLRATAWTSFVTAVRRDELPACWRGRESFAACCALRDVQKRCSAENTPEGSQVPLRPAFHHAAVYGRK